MSTNHGRQQPNNQRRTWAHKSFISLTLLLILASIQITLNQSYAAGQLMIAPTRVVFEGRDRSAQINVMNTGSATETYRISFVEKRMSKTGDFITIEKDEAGESVASNMIRYSPRQVVLPPGKSQTIRLMLRRPKDISEGEYRSHLYFQNIPKNSAKNVDQLVSDDNKQVKIELTPIVGITIPVIVRHGKTTVDSALQNMNLITPNEEDPRTKLAFQINRQGNQSSYGDLTATFIPNSGSKKIIGRANGVAVYLPNSYRKVQMLLNLEKGQSLSNGKILMTYRERPEDGGALLASTELLLP